MCCLTYGGETTAMMRGRAEQCEREPVMGGAIAAIVLPPEPGMMFSQADHQSIARDLGDNRCGGDRCGGRVAADNQAFGAGKARRAVAVDQREVGHAAKPPRQCGDGPSHRQERRLQNVEAVDLFNRANTDTDRRGLLDKSEQDFTLGFLEDFGIVDPVGDLSEIEHDGRGDHGTRQWPATGLVDPSDDLADGLALKAKVWSGLGDVDTLGENVHAAESSMAPRGGYLAAAAECPEICGKLAFYRIIYVILKRRMGDDLGAKGCPSHQCAGARLAA